MRKKSDTKTEIRDDENHANHFLERIRTGTHDLKSKELLPASKYLYFIRDQFRENLKFHYCSSNQIFQAACDDPNGFAYWQGWFNKLRLTVEDFARLLAIHGAVEYSDTCVGHKDCVLKDQTGTQIKPQRASLEFYKIRREKVISILLEASKMDKASDALRFEGEVDALKAKNADVMIAHGWVREGDKLWSLTKVDLYPHSTLEWFVAVPERAELLPKSLCVWWTNSKRMEIKDTLGAEQRATKKEGTTSNKMTSESAPELFMQSLQVSYLNDTEIKIKVGHKKPIIYKQEELGFKKHKSKIWQELIGILKRPDHTHYVGKAYGLNKTRKRSYDVSQKILVEINKKIVTFLNGKYNSQLPEKFKVYELIPNKKQEAGAYRFKFQICNFDDSGHSKNKYEDFSQELLIAEIEKLSSALGLVSAQGDEGAEKRIEQIKNELLPAIEIACKKEWLPPNRAKSYLNPESNSYSPISGEVYEKE